MSSLKALRNRINSVKSTRKITSAMKMVAAAKLRRAQEAAENSRPYAERLDRMLQSLTAGTGEASNQPALMAGTGQDATHLLVVMSADRGLCGSFNSSILRETRKEAARLRQQGKTVKLLLIGRKAGEALKRDESQAILGQHTGIGGRGEPAFHEAAEIGADIRQRFENGEFDVATMVYNHFRSAISQVVTFEQIIPFQPAEADSGAGSAGGQAADGGPQAQFEFEPDEEQILADLLPRNVNVQIFKALLDSSASEQGARMTAMDNATRNADEMIENLTLQYNRTRQAVVTKELMEIISGAEAQ